MHLTFARRAYELAAWYRERGSIVVLGGPKHMTPEDLYEGYGRPTAGPPRTRRSGAGARATAAVPAYLGMSYFYKRSNRFWPFLIERGWTARAWRPLIEISRRRHVRYHKRLAGRGPSAKDSRSSIVASPGV